MALSLGTATDSAGNVFSRRYLYIGGGSVKVAGIVVVDANTTPLAANATTLVITGSGLTGTTLGDLTFSGAGAITAASIVVNSDTMITVTLTPSASSLGVLQLVIANGTGSSAPAVTVAIIVPAPTLNANSGLDISTTSTTIAITGTGWLAPATITFTTYVFAVTSANATGGATYTNNTQTFTVENTISAATILIATGTGAPTASGTLTKSGGTGDATITFSAFVLPTGTVSVTDSTDGVVTFTTSPGANGTTPYALNAFVTTNGASTSTVTVCTVTSSADAPIVNSNPTATLTTDSTEVTVYGLFLPTSADTSVVLTPSGTASGSAGSGGSVLNLTISGIAAGPLSAVVTDTSTGLNSGKPVVIATVGVDLSITPSTQLIANNCYGYPIPVSGTGFAAFTATAGGSGFVFTSGTNAALVSSTQLTLTPSLSIGPFSVGAINMQMQLTPAGAVTGFVEIAEAVLVSITMSSSSISSSAVTVTIAGMNFDPSIVATPAVTFTVGSTSWTGLVTSVASDGSSLVAVFNGAGQPAFAGGESVFAIVNSYHGNSGGSSGTTTTQIGTISGSGGGGPTVPTPTFSPAAGSYIATQSVYISDILLGVGLYYTTDGSTPTFPVTGTTAAYTGAITVTATAGETIKAICVKAGYTTSSVASATYIVGQTVATPTFSPAAGSYSGTQSVTLSCSTSGASIYYTTDGTTPTSGSTLYTGAISVATSETVKAIGILAGWTDSSVASAAYTIVPTAVVFNAGNGQTWTVPGGVTSLVDVYGWASGGSGAVDGVFGGGGGGGGGFARTGTLAVTPGDVLTINVPAGGSGGAATVIHTSATVLEPRLAGRTLSATRTVLAEVVLREPTCRLAEMAGTVMTYLAAVAVRQESEAVAVMRREVPEEPVGARLRC